MSMVSVTIMKVLVYFIAGVYSLEWQGTSSEVPKQNNNRVDSFNFVTSESNVNSSYLETSEVPDPERLSLSSQRSFAGDFGEAEPVISEPLFEDMSWNKSDPKMFSVKRDISQPLWSHENKMRILQLHNLYRSNVTPPAGDMTYMEWDEELEKLAQIWADRCVFEHGMPGDYQDIGQNLYIGTDPTGYLGLYLWYEEYHNYDLRNEVCLPNKQCGHYVQMAWSESNKLGCAMSKCGMRYYVVCHYIPQAKKGLQMYRVAKPCSQFLSKAGMLCLNNLCMTPEQCKNNPFDCKFAECKLECHNCGRLDKEKCKCECADGWDSPDCSYLCQDKHMRCGMNPGWPTKASCSLNAYAVAKTYCRKMCETCHPLLETSNDTCCDGKLCDNGFVLDPHDKSCKCILLCPGPLCDDKDVIEAESSVQNGADYLRIVPYFVKWMIALKLSEKFLWRFI